MHTAPREMLAAAALFALAWGTGARADDNELAKARALFARGHYERAHQHFAAAEKRGALSASDRACQAYCIMTRVYRLRSAYRENPRFQPTDADWAELEDMVRKAKKLAPTIDYADQVLAELARERRPALAKAERDGTQRRNK